MSIILFHPRTQNYSEDCLSLLLVRGIASRVGTFDLNATAGMKGGDGPGGPATLLTSLVDGSKLHAEATGVAHFQVTPTAGVVLGELLSGGLLSELSAADGLKLSDAPQAFLSILRSLIDAIIISDSPSETAALKATPIAGIKAGASPTVQADMNVGARGSTLLGDTTSGHAKFPRDVIDGMILSDQGQGTLTIPMSAFDGLSMGESVGAMFQLIVTVTAGMKLSDLTIQWLPQGVTATFTANERTFRVTASRRTFRFEALSKAGPSTEEGA